MATKLTDIFDNGGATDRPIAPVKDLTTLYYQNFDVRDVVTQELRTIAHRLRFQVYCVENAYEKPENSPFGLEFDMFDSHAGSAVLFHKATGLPAGTIRMVLPLAQAPDQSFALQMICNEPMVAGGKRVPIEQTGEISRFCIPKNVRRQLESFPVDPRYHGAACDGPEWRRVIPHITLGLIEWLVRYSVQVGLTHLCAAMEPRLLRLLGRLGVHFEPIGGVVEFHGPRQPCCADLKILLGRVRIERPDVFDVITANGDHYDALDDPRGYMGGGSANFPVMSLVGAKQAILLETTPEAETGNITLN